MQQTYKEKIITITHFSSVISSVLNFIVTVSNRSVSTSDIGVGAGACESGIRFNTDGTVDSKTDNEGSGVIYAQVGASTDWIIPNSASSSTFYIRATEVFFEEVEVDSAFFTTKNGTMNTWLALSSAREWSLDAGSNTLGTGNSQWIITIEIASDSGGVNVLSSGQVTLNGEV